MDKQRKEIPILVEGGSPIGYHLLELVAKSQAIAIKQYGATALAVYRLPNRYYDGTPPAA